MFRAEKVLWCKAAAKCSKRSKGRACGAADVKVCPTANGIMGAPQGKAKSRWRDLALNRETCINSNAEDMSIICSSRSSLSNFSIGIRQTPYHCPGAKVQAVKTWEKVSLTMQTLFGRSTGVYMHCSSPGSFCCTQVDDTAAFAFSKDQCG